MDQIITERSGSILRVELNRPAKRNAMTSRMYVTLANVFNDAAKDERIRVVLWHGAGDSFCAGNDVEDFLKNPSGPGESPQARLMHALLDFDKPLVAAVQDADALRLRTRGREREVSDAFRQSCRGAGIRIELLRSSADRAHPRRGVDLVGAAFRRQACCGFRIRRPGRARSEPSGDGKRNRAGVGSEAGRRVASQQATHEAAFFREHIKAAMKAKNEEFSAQVRSADAKEAFAAFLEKRLPHFTGTVSSSTAA